MVRRGCLILFLWGTTSSSKSVTLQDFSWGLRGQWKECLWFSPLSSRPPLWSFLQRKGLPPFPKKRELHLKFRYPSMAFFLLVWANRWLGIPFNFFKWARKNTEPPLLSPPLPLSLFPFVYGGMGCPEEVLNAMELFLKRKSPSKRILKGEVSFGGRGW